ncbi:Mor transcription activator family protein [Ottowia testudinis]|uniref:Mor transcription activator domain-containing protein n=1 Tax=Ottowia testudinis TaxID=2816950 RepID=A0A975CJJ3_9BURK|nr:Mor transcription activator family protein [Ottowia testudinis]QTD46162.1 hypothetical protein J1M35_04450 [Ottowia testudinis]
MDATLIKPLRLETLPADALDALKRETDPAITPKQRELAESIFVGLINSPAAERCTKDVLAQAAIVVLIQLSNDLGGFNYYITRMGNLRAAALRRAIHAAFTGRNVAQLARQHGLTDMRVRQILAEGP